MDIQAIKIDLIHWLTKLDDITLLEELKLLKEKHEVDLSEDHKDFLDERLEFYEQNPNELIDWEDIVKELD
ncbi:addiction module protein [Belliella sp. R4-6]|uniref:Addiction module protein n=1 Tax=Belliella alkalica TaxID=1730871 RepID=A0ABS9VAF2_9BACT|nr:addiction module protein [Belliella alkalica]MCH7413416.1 addiction module protein [Belliella alkalica]